MNRIFDATVENTEKVIDFVNEQLAALDFPLREQTQIDIAVDELFSNIARYAYAASENTADVGGTAEVSVEADEGTADNHKFSVVITFTDSGIPFNPLETDSPDITKNAEERDVGGLGIFIVKKTMDGISYEFKDGKNILTIKKTAPRNTGTED